MMGMPNVGHAAVSDLLVSRAAHAAMSTNFDRMIESWAQNLKVDLRGALNGQEATAFSTITGSPSTESALRQVWIPRSRDFGGSMPFPLLRRRSGRLP